MIPNFKMGFYHQREYLESEKIGKKTLKETMEGFEYSSLFSSKTYSIMSYVVGGFVGSKSQMNNNKHNLSYDLSAAVINLLNLHPCKHEKAFKKCGETLYSATSPMMAYDKYIVRSSQKGKMLEMWGNFMLEFYKQSPQSNCDEHKLARNSQTVESANVTDTVQCSEVVSSQNSRCRPHSECSADSTDSESFIVFDSPDQDYLDDDDNDDDVDNAFGGIEVKKTWELDNFNFDSDNSDCEEEENENDYGFGSFEKELADANDRWKNNYKDVKTEDSDESERKVRFNDKIKINNIVAWDFAYRAARAGPWEQIARDRVRFRERILRLSPTISPVLKKEYRDKIYKELYS